MRYLSLFSGIEAATVALRPLGWVCVAVAEIEKFPSGLLRTRYPNVPNLGDITKITEADIAMLGDIDVVIFGSPCQDLSVAGKRKGLDGVRSGLFFKAIDIIRWARVWGGCRWAWWENVPGAFSSNKGRDFAAVVDALAGCDGTAVPPKGWGTEGAAAGEEGMVEWATLDAQWFGVAQRRRRVFAVADFGDWSGRPPVLLERQGLRGDSAPRRGPREDVAGTLTRGLGERGAESGERGLLIPHRAVATSLDASFARLQGCSGQDLNHGHSHLLVFGGNNTSGPIDAATALNANRGCHNPGDFEAGNLVVCATGDVTHTLKADGFDASEDGTGRGTPIAAVLPFDTTQITSATNRSNPGFGDPCHPLAAGGHPPAIAFPANLSGTQYAASVNVAPSLGALNPTAVAFQSSQSGVRIGDVHATLDSSNGSRRHNGVLTDMQVRRLTPLECERLQALPDNYTAIAQNRKPAADGPRYKALGNSMCVNVMRWIGWQIDYAHRYF